MSSKFSGFLIATALVCAGCQKDSFTEDNGPWNITFDVAVEQDTKGGPYTYSTLDSLNSFKTTIYDITNGSTITKLSTVSKSNNKWLLSSPLLWSNDHELNFFAYANMPADTNISIIRYSSTTTQYLDVKAIPEATANHIDPLLGHYRGTGDKGKATITFYHPLTAVKFILGSLGETPDVITGITSITLNDAYIKGKCKVTTRPNLAYSTWSSLETGSVTGNIGDTFIFIPSNKVITMDITVSYSEGTQSKITYASFTSKLEAGKVNIFTLNYANNSIKPELTVTLDDWSILQSTSGDKYFNANCS